MRLKYLLPICFFVLLFQGCGEDSNESQEAESTPQETEENVPQGINNSPIVWSTHTNKCLDVSGGGTANGTNIQLWNCNASNANQKFNYDPQTKQIIWATHTNKCLDVSAGGTANGTNIQLWDCNASNANQKFNM